MAGMAMANPQVRMSTAFTKSLVFHAVLLGAFGGWAWNNAMILGEQDAGGLPGSVEIVDVLPQAARTPVIPVANESESLLPQEEAEKPASKEEKAPEPEKAELVPGPPEKTKQRLEPKSRLPSLTALDQRTKSEEKPAGGPVTALKGSGQIGESNLDAVFGDKFGAYATQIRDITQRNWDHSGVARSVSQAAVVRFQLHRNGKVSGVTLKQRSGLAALDQSARDAIENANYPEFPRELNKESVEVEFTFRLR